MKISRFKNLFKTALIAAPLLALPVACGDSSDGDAEQSDGFGTRQEGVQMTGTLNLTTLPSSAALNLAESSYTFYCVTFETTPAAASAVIADNGAFTIDVWTGVNFGCFVNETATMKTVATMMIKDVGSSGLGNAEATGLQISGNIDIGEFSVENGVAAVKIPSTEIDKLVKNQEPVLQPSDIHNKTFTIACSNTDAIPQEAVTACTYFFDGKGTMDVFFRTLAAKENGTAIRGLAVWESETAFATTCGGFDFSSEEQTSIANEGVTFDSSVKIGAFPEACRLRTDETPPTPEARMAVGPLNKNGMGWTFNQHETWQQGQTEGCEINQVLSLDFTGSASKLAGMFNITKTATEQCQASDLDGESNIGNNIFPVTFTPKG